MTPAIEVGTRPVGLEGEPVYCYRLAPGAALKGDGSTGTYTDVEISKAQAKRAEYTYTLKWIRGKTVCMFELDGETYYQLLPMTGAPAVPAKAPKADRPRLTKVKTEPEPPAQAQEEPPQEKKPRKRVGLL